MHVCKCISNGSQQFEPSGEAIVVVQGLFGFIEERVTQCKVLGFQEFTDASVPIQEGLDYGIERICTFQRVEIDASEVLLSQQKDPSRDLLCVGCE